MNRTIVRGMLAFVFLATLAGFVSASETENLNMKILPVPGKVAIDGNIEDWDLSNGIFCCGDVENQRDKYAIWIHAMWDANNVYILARWIDLTPMTNPGSIKGDYGFNGDCLQVRFVTAPADKLAEAATRDGSRDTRPDLPGTRTSHITAWRDRDGLDTINIAWGWHFDEGDCDAKDKGGKQAFRKHNDGRGYTQELSIPWALLSRDGWKPTAGAKIVMTVQPSFLTGAGSRLTSKDIFRPGGDIFRPGADIDRVYTFMAPNGWGFATLESNGKLELRTVRLRDGREFPVRFVDRLPCVDWTGLVKSREPTAPPAATAGGDWNQWRGPNRNGVAPDSPKLADEWGMNGPELLWKSEPITEGGFGSPVVVKGKVYLFVTSKVYEGQGRATDVIVCLDANTGATLWQTDFPGRNSGWGASSTPCVFDGRLWAVGSNGMYCLDAATGKEIWKVPSIGEILSSSPTLVNGVIVVSVRTLKGFEAATGKELWACPQAGPGHGTGENTSPAVWKTAQRQYVITNMGKLTCVNPQDGTVVWQGEAADCNSTPSITGDTCLVGSPVAGYKLAPDKALKLFGTGLRDRAASQILYNGYVFAFSGGAIRCLDLTGKQLWEQGVGGEISSPVLADGKIFLVCSDDKLAMIRATPEKPAKVYEARIPALGCSSPAVWDGKLFVRLKAAVACYDLTKFPMESGNAPPRPPETPKDVAPGLQVAYYAGRDLRWPRIGGVPQRDAYYAGGDFSVVQNLDRAVPEKTGTTAGIDLAFAVAKENFGLKFTGYIEVPKDGRYTFYTNSDGGSKLFIGKTPVVDNDGSHGPKEESGSIQLKAGKHALTVYYTQGGGGSALSASYEGPDIPKGLIPANVLWHDAK